MKPLPIDSRLPEILDLVRAHRRLVLVAPPGAGKTTRVPGALLDAGVVTGEVAFDIRSRGVGLDDHLSRLGGRTIGGPIST